jgi:ParB family transcriptional regulator, chromosome partitioning protein
MPPKSVLLPIEFLQPGQYQPRQQFKIDTLQELADSIKTHGIIQPLLVRQIATEKFEIIAGERRWRAAQLAGLQNVPVTVKSLTEEQAMTLALIENIQREDLNPLEEAKALKKLLDTFNFTHQQLAEKVGKSRAVVTNALRLLELSAEVKELVTANQLSAGHARALLSLNHTQQQQLAEKIIKQGLSVRATERLVANILNKKPPLQTRIDKDILYLQQLLSEKLNTPVKIHHNTKTGSGHLNIAYSSLEELDGILQRFD